MPESSESAKPKETTPPVFYILLAPDVGPLDLITCADVSDFSKQTHKWLTAKANGSYKGSIFPFLGWLVDFTLPLQTFRINIPNHGEVEIGEGVKGKYLGLASSTQPVQPDGQQQ